MDKKLQAAIASKALLGVALEQIKLVRNSGKIWTEGTVGNETLIDTTHHIQSLIDDCDRIIEDAERDARN